MKYSKLFGKTRYNEQSGSEFISHQLLSRGGFIAESTAGRYFFLPLGWRVHDKIKAIIKQEMDKTGAQEMISPTLHPIELWQETNRTSTVGFELMSIKDRRGSEFALGGTAEEMFVDVVRKFNLSYRDLPFNIYQFSTKFRDEMRARGGLLRVREFVMKDAYSFSTDEKQFKEIYKSMAKTYHAIFKKLGLASIMVEADNGYIGGEYCHEFQVESPIGEGRFLVSTDKKYAAHEDVAKFYRDPKNVDEELKPLTEVDAVRGNSMQEGVKFHNLPLWQQMKDVMFANEKGELILVVLRGDLDVNEAKLMHITGAAQLRAATVDEIKAIGSEPGFISPIGLKGKVKMIVGDISLNTVKNMYGGANKKHRDMLNINLGRDFEVDILADVAVARHGDLTEDGKSRLTEKKGIEVGNIFQLGYHYSSKMNNAVYTTNEGKKEPYYMGCYGIGLGRTLATVVEINHDEHGIIWPESIAPFKAHLISLGGADEKAQAIYDQLTEAGIEVLWDERQVSAGTKFTDADMIGCPYRLVVSAKTGDQIEVKKRSLGGAKQVSLSELMDMLQK